MQKTVLTWKKLGVEAEGHNFGEVDDDEAGVPVLLTHFEIDVIIPGINFEASVLARWVSSFIRKKH